MYESSYSVFYLYRGTDKHCSKCSVRDHRSDIWLQSKLMSMQKAQSTTTKTGAAPYPRHYKRVPLL